MTDEERSQLSRKIDKISLVLETHGKMLSDLTGDVKDLKEKVAPLDADRVFRSKLTELGTKIIGFLALLGGAWTVIPVLYHFLIPPKP